MEENDREYREAVNSFYRVYVPAQKKYNLRMNTSFSLFDSGMIEIWRYEGEVSKEQVCRVRIKDEDKTVSAAVYYRRALQELKDYIKKTEGQINGGNAADHAGSVACLEGRYQGEAS